MTSTRRAFLGSAAGFGSAIAIADWALVQDALAHAAAAVQQQPPARFSTLTPAEAAELGAIADRVMPTTDTPGAREAGVVFFMDKAFGSFMKDGLPDVRKGLADLKQRSGRKKRGAASFAALATAEQDAVLRDIESTEFFGTVKFMTWLGMFGEPSYGGNRNEVGWKLLNFDPHGPHKPPFGYYDAEATKR